MHETLLNQDGGIYSADRCIVKAPCGSTFGDANKMLNLALESNIASEYVLVKLKYAVVCTRAPTSTCTEKRQPYEHMHDTHTQRHVHVHTHTRE